MKNINPLILSILTIVIVQINTWCQYAKFTDIGSVLCIDYSSDGKLIVTTTASRVTIWQKTTKNILHTVATSGAECAKFSKDSPSSYIAISIGATIEVISGISPFGSIQTFGSGHGGTNPPVRIDFDSTTLITCGGTNGKVKTWNIANNPATSTLVASYTNVVFCTFLTSTKVGLWKSSGGGTLQTVTISPPTGITSTMSTNVASCNQISLAQNFNFMLAACNSGTNDGIYVQTGSGTITDIVTSGGMLTTSFAGDGNTLCYGGDTKILYIVLSNHTIISQFITTSNIQTSDFTPDGSYLIIGTQDSTIYQYAKYCLSCLPGYYQNLTTKTCVQCETTMQGCAFCKNSSYCDQCYQNYIYDNTTNKCLSCATLIDGCGTCFNSTACRYCMVGFYLLLPNYTCSSCQASLIGCYQCNSSSYCYICQSDFYLNTTSNNNTCVPCQYTLANCIKCVNSSYCTTCKIGYYNNAGTCALCSTNCYICQSATNCTDCITGYYTATSGGSTTCSRCSTGCLACNATGYCRNCDDNRYLSSGSCNLCTYPCLTCNSSSYCLSCDTAYYFNGTGLCTQCSSGCISCNSSSVCLSCSSGYYLNTTSLTCLTCQKSITNCMQCTDTICLKCQIRYFLQNNTTCTSCLSAMNDCIVCSSSTTCQFCSPGFYKTTSGTGNASCQICSTGCATCASSSNCTSCNVGYYLISASGTCNTCINNCIGCSSATVCLQCQIGYRLNTNGTCTKCSSDISYCQSCIYNYTASAIWCLSCQLGKYLSTTGVCLFCPTNCTTCINSSYCTTCQIGMYLNTNNTCTACNHNCSQCIGIPNNCSSCIAGYYLTSSYTCQHCSVYGCATCNSTTHNCLSCQLGYYLKTVTGPPTIICDNCLSAISNCYICTSSTICKQCAYGYALATNYLSCSPCSVVQGCKHCTTLLSCQNCEVGYYLVVNGTTGYGVCNKCISGCKDCSNNGVCITCFSQYYVLITSGTISCKLCQLTLVGCLTCSSTPTCLSCQPAYYLSSGTCKLCSQPIFACKYCNSSSICTHCQDSYYLSNNTCIKCQSSMTGCRLCNSSSVCLYCQYGMYLTNNTCYICSVNLPNCLYCLNLTTCLQCDTGSYLTTTGCLNCQAHITGCIQCNSITDCLQCRSAYFLNSTTHLCQPCKQQGCQICLQSNPLSCIKCNSLFYYNSTLTTCIKCRTQISNCKQCTNSTQCIICQPAYFINSTKQCQLCQSVIHGCSRCDNIGTSCLQCKSTFYIHTDNTCRDCKLAMIGCSHCINGTICQSCYNGYFMNSSGLCQSCTTLLGCLACTNSTNCLYCQSSYFLQSSQHKCYPCQALQGCYACTDNITCAICKGGYMLSKSDQLCHVMRVQSQQIVTDLKLVTKFVNQSYLIHYLYAKDMIYTQNNSINWVKTTQLILEDSAYNQTKLTILHVQFQNQYTLTFYTNNPLKLNNNNFQFTRRLLLSGSLQSKYKVNLQMDQQTINSILPNYYLPQDLIMGYSITAPQFVMSYINNGGNGLVYYSVFGYVITGLFIVKYVVKALWTVPGSAEMGDIIPQVLALKAPAFMIYPTFLQFIFYCSGFMIPDIPWLNQMFGKLLADPSDVSAQPYSMFYLSMQIGNTYFTAILTIIVLTFIMWLIYKAKQQSFTQGFPLGNVVFNIFIFGAVWAGCACTQGAFLNSITTVTLNSGLYMFGIAFYCIIFGICLYTTYNERKNLYRVRIFIKATLLALANMSPIYIFCTSFLVDIILVAIQINMSNIKFMYPKIWVAKNIILDIALTILVFLPTVMLSLIVASFLVTIVFFMDCFTHLKQYKVAKLRKKFMPQANQSDVDVNIWNINYQRSMGKYKLQQFNNDQIDQKKQQILQDIKIDMNEAARKTGFQKTQGSFNSQNIAKLQAKRKQRKTKITKQKPDVIDPQNPNEVEKLPQIQLEADKQNVFMAKQFLQ